MALDVYYPKIQVRLIKLVGRKDGVSERYKAADRVIDLTPMLGDSSTIRTLKTTHEPVGAFTIVFPDSGVRSTKDTLYALIEPADMIEIRATRRPEAYAGQDLPLIMRGFVTSIRRIESMGRDGPEREVVIAGQDAGRLWMINQILHPLVYALESPFLDKYKLQAATGYQVGMLPAGDFMKKSVELINDKVKKLAAFSDQHVQPFTLRSSVEEGVVSHIVLSSMQGHYWNIIEYFADKPWNELFVEDEEDGPVLVFRPAPYKDLDGKLIMDGAAEPDTIECDISEVVSLDVRRTDGRIGNFFWVPPGNSSLHTNGMVTVVALNAGEPLDFDYANNKPELYGVRMMTYETHLLPTTTNKPFSHLSAAEQGKEADRIKDWHLRRAAELKRMNRDNSVLEEGTAVVKGDDTLKIGRYLKMKRGQVTSEAYITRVAHTIQPFRGWTASVTLERATGFLERNKLEGSPVFMEGKMGAYS